MKITVNGVEHDVEGDEISHERIVALAHQLTHASVTYRGPKHGDSRRAGTTYAGKSVKLEDGMIFDAVVTGHA